MLLVQISVASIAPRISRFGSAWLWLLSDGLKGPVLRLGTSEFVRIIFEGFKGKDDEDVVEDTSVDDCVGKDDGGECTIVSLFHIGISEAQRPPVRVPDVITAFLAANRAVKLVWPDTSKRVTRVPSEEPRPLRPAGLKRCDGTVAVLE